MQSGDVYITSRQPVALHLRMNSRDYTRNQQKGSSRTCRAPLRSTGVCACVVGGGKIKGRRVRLGVEVAQMPRLLQRVGLRLAKLRLGRRRQLAARAEVHFEDEQQGLLKECTHRGRDP